MSIFSGWISYFSFLVFSGSFHLTHYKLVTFSGGSEGSPEESPDSERLERSDLGEGDERMTPGFRISSDRVTHLKKNVGEGKDR